MAGNGVSTDEVLDLYHRAYGAEPFVVVTDTPPSTKATTGSNCAHVDAVADERSGWVVALCALDNLMKGGSGQAVQCANLLLGLPEATGLPTTWALPVSVTAPAGFVATGGSAGIKASGEPDLAVVATADGRPVAAAGVFTTNLAPAAPVQVSREHLAKTGGAGAAVLLTSGNANAATGQAGRAAAVALCEAVAEGLGAEAAQVLVCQTGLIGVPFPIDVVLGRVGVIVAGRGPAEQDAAAAARAILTTDTVAKEAVVEAGGFTIGAMAKGVAMLAPRMATMLTVVTTDARLEPPALHRALAEAVGPSFNALTVDGCTSTNDTVLVLASGLAGPVAPEEFTAALGEVCGSLARQMAADAEGATKVVAVRVTGARVGCRGPPGAPARSRSPSSSSARSTVRTRTGAGW